MRPRESHPIHLKKYTGTFGSSDTDMLVTSNNSIVFEGKCSGMVIVDNGSRHYYIGVTDTVTLPTNGNPVYLELNYRATAEFSIGVFDGEEGNSYRAISLWFYHRQPGKKMCM